MKKFAAEFCTALILLVSLSLILCGLYPLGVWAIAQGLFPYQANGSLIAIDGGVVGSSQLAQNFSAREYFHPRPSYAGDGYDGSNSGGSNLGPTSRKLIHAVSERISRYCAENGLAPHARVPADAVTASASGLDPHITLPNALIQAKRVARARNLTENEVKARLKEHTESRQLGILGEERVNVLRLNLALDGKL